MDIRRGSGECLRTRHFLSAPRQVKQDQPRPAKPLPAPPSVCPVVFRPALPAACPSCLALILFFHFLSRRVPSFSCLPASSCSAGLVQLSPAHCCPVYLLFFLLRHFSFYPTLPALFSRCLSLLNPARFPNIVKRLSFHALPI